MFKRLQAFKWYHFCENAKASEERTPWIVLRLDAGLLENPLFKSALKTSKIFAALGNLMQE